MITTGIKNTTKAADSLLTILADPKKAEELLKKITAENKKLAKQTKDLMGAKSVIAFCTEKEKQAEQAKSYVTQVTEELETERKKFDEYKNKTNAILSKRVADAAEKEEAAMATITQASKMKDEIVAKYEELDKQQEAVEVLERKALALKEEYTNKLNDLKERMRGL